MDFFSKEIKVGDYAKCLPGYSEDVAYPRYGGKGYKPNRIFKVKKIRDTVYFPEDISHYVIHDYAIVKIFSIRLFF